MMQASGEKIQKSTEGKGQNVITTNQSADNFDL
jgi:hypothetical protein